VVLFNVWLQFGKNDVADTDLVFLLIIKRILREDFTSTSLSFMYKYGGILLTIR